MKKRRDLSQGHLYDSYIAPVQTYDEKKPTEIFKLTYVKEEEKKLRKEIHARRGFKGTSTNRSSSIDSSSSMVRQIRHLLVEDSLRTFCRRMVLFGLLGHSRRSHQLHDRQRSHDV
jgi:hypothetical protein